MKTQNTNQIQAAQPQAGPPDDKKDKKDIRSWLQNSPTAMKELAALSKGLMSGERLVNVIYQCMRKTPALLECKPAAIMSATKTLVLMGCEPDGINGYIVPVRRCVEVNGRKQWVQDAMPVPSARGLMRMAKQNGIANIQTGVVKEGEYFKWGVKDGKFSCSHLPNLEARDTAKTLYYYVLWSEKAGGALHGELMTEKEVQAIRARSKAKNDGPWVTDYEQMALKTVIKRAAKMWPLPYETNNALIEADNAEFSQRTMRNVTGIQPAAESLPEPEPQENHSAQLEEDVIEAEQVEDSTQNPELFDMPEQNTSTPYQD